MGLDPGVPLYLPEDVGYPAPEGQKAFQQPEYGEDLAEDAPAKPYETRPGMPDPAGPGSVCPRLGVGIRMAEDEHGDGLIVITIGQKEGSCPVRAFAPDLRSVRQGEPHLPEAPGGERAVHHGNGLLNEPTNRHLEGIEHLLRDGLIAAVGYAHRLGEPGPEIGMEPPPDPRDKGLSGDHGILGPIGRSLERDLEIIDIGREDLIQKDGEKASQGLTVAVNDEI